MKLIKEIKEGQSWTSSFIGWKIMTYRALDDSTKKSLKLGINLGFLLVKMEFILI